MEIWNRLSYRNKTYVFLVVAFLLGVVIYMKKISPTLEQRAQLSELTQLQDNATLDQEISMMKTELHYLDKVLGKDRKDLESINKEIINHISFYGDSTHVELVQMPRAHEFNEQGFRIYTHVVTVKGNFRDLLGLAHYFETGMSGMKLASSHYFSKRDPRTKRKELFLELYIQSYEKF